MLPQQSKSYLFDGFRQEVNLNKNTYILFKINVNEGIEKKGNGVVLLRFIFIRILLTYHPFTISLLYFFNQLIDRVYRIFKLGESPAHLLLAMAIASSD